MKYTITWAHWRVPSEERAFEGWLEGSPTPEERAEILGEIARERKNWAPSSDAWGQLRALERFVAKRVCIQFWDPIMHLLDGEGPYPVLADFKRIALLRREGFQQAYLVLDRIQEWPKMEGSSLRNSWIRKSSSIARWLLSLRCRRLTTANAMKTVGCSMPWFKRPSLPIAVRFA